MGFVFFGATGGLEVILALFAKEGEELAPISEMGRFFDVVCSEIYFGHKQIHFLCLVNFYEYLPLCDLS